MSIRRPFQTFRLAPPPTRQFDRNQYSMNTKTLRTCVEFLRAIGLNVEIKPGASGFFDRIEIRQGGLLVDPGCSLSELLHEAGHLAIIPWRYRHLMNGDLESGWTKMFERLETDGVSPESRLYGACLNASDLEATAWAWAVGKSLGFATSKIIRDCDYQGEGAEIRFLLQSGMYLGIAGLAAGGFCSSNAYGVGPVFPKLAFWTQEIDELSVYGQRST